MIFLRTVRVFKLSLKNTKSKTQIKPELDLKPKLKQKFSKTQGQGQNVHLSKINDLNKKFHKILKA